ncbi:MULTISPECIES: hypothetical protein [Exiguobacterium]|uniref:DUF4129 domain-containing protein n=1 Tax=Exiguobacterium acetylicum TaxID=41170 RepID=A0ABX8G6T4_EXIAC|nr:MULTISPECIES: hypothetical protein [Exiguobacterium]AOT00836.1 hypothetical protein ESP131_11410 [Exiguobacterium sp. U13-1]QWB28787.1 hypothetical protein KKI46_09240 [Exiguobacterium acetylicum]
MKRGLVVTLCITLVSLAAIQLVGTEVYRYFFYDPATYQARFMVDGGGKEEGKPTEQKMDIQSGGFADKDALGVATFYSVVGLAILLIVLFSVRYFLKRLRKRRKRENVIDDLMQPPPVFSPNRSTRQTLVGEESESEIRRLLQKFDRQLTRQKRRRSEETVGEWLQRIDVTLDPSIYHLVRYGDTPDSAISQDQVDGLRHELQVHLQRD